MKLRIELDLILLNRFNKLPVTLLSKGVDYWNLFRESKPNFIFNLSGADLSGLDFRDVNFTDTNLSGANLSDSDLKGANLGRANLCGANLIHTNLRDAWLRDAFLDGANLRYTNLRGANLQDTDLRNVDLTYSDMMGADLRNVDLRKTNLSTVNFWEVNLRGADLSEANLGGTNLSVANLLESNFFRANLSEAILVQADLNGADFREANLTNANLTRAQALGTNFQKAIFTGACVEYWNPHHPRTNLDTIICEYVYLKNDKQERRPSSGIFQTGDFTRLSQRAFETLDLIFQNGIDWKSFAATLQELNSNQKLNIEGDNLQLIVRAIENLDDGSFVIRVDVPKSIDKAETEAEIKKKYKKRLEAQAEQYRQQLQAKDREIERYHHQNTNLTEAIVTLASKPIKIENNFMPTNESKGDTYNQSNMGIGHVSGGELKENKIAGTINEAANPSLADAATEIRNLLTELEKSYPANTTIEKMVIATKAIERIEADPAWQKRTVNALKLGSVAALEKAIDSPIGAFLKGAFEGWENAK